MVKPFSRTCGIESAYSIFSQSPSCSTFWRTVRGKPRRQLILTSLSSAYRSFFQVGGPPPGEPGNKSKAQNFMKSRAAEMDERLAKKRADHDSFYKDRVKPMPLFENAYQPGEFGMRRRLVILHRKEKKKTWDAKERGLAVGDAQTSFLK